MRMLKDPLKWPSYWNWASKFDKSHRKEILRIIYVRTPAMTYVIAYLASCEQKSNV